MCAYAPSRLYVWKEGCTIINSLVCLKEIIISFKSFWCRHLTRRKTTADDQKPMKRIMLYFMISNAYSYLRSSVFDREERERERERSQTRHLRPHTFNILISRLTRIKRKRKKKKIREFLKVSLSLKLTSHTHTHKFYLPLSPFSYSIGHLFFECSAVSVRWKWTCSGRG